MKPTVVVAAVALAVGTLACAESALPTDATATETVRYSQAAEVVADDGRAFVVEVEFDGTIAPGIIDGLLDGISIVTIEGVRPVDEGPVFDGFADAQDGITILPMPGIELIVTPADPGYFMEDNPWYMIEHVDPREIERAYEDACPAWH
jgi:hypothetical protein